MSDVALFCNSYPNVEVSYELDAEGEAVEAGAALSLNVQVQREVDGDEDKAELGVVRSARYTNDKTESWWLLVGDKRTNALLSIKRITLLAQARVKLQFVAPESSGHKM